MRVLKTTLRCGRRWVSVLLAFACVSDPLLAQTEVPLSKVAEIAAAFLSNPTNDLPFQLQGQVLWADAGQGRLVLQDSMGAEELELNFNGASIGPGDRVKIEGRGTILRSGAALRLGTLGAVVDNNGVHSMIEKSGAVYLESGFQPIRLEWFNGLEKCGLELEWQGPQMPRESIPAAFLHHGEAGSALGAGSLPAGLEYRCFEGDWEALPDFHRLIPVKEGIAANFDLNVTSRTEHVALQFSGYLKILRSGLYTFFLKSDDGSRLFVGRPSVRISKVGVAELPAPRKLLPGQILSESESQWAQVEGAVTFADDQPPGLLLELQSGAGRMRLEIANGNGLSAARLLNSRIRATGVCQGVFTADGQITASAMLISDAQQIRLLQPSNRGGIEEIETNAETLPVLTAAVEVHRLKREQAKRGYPVQLRGVVTSVLPEHQAFTIQDSTRGLYVVDFSTSRPTPARAGEFLEIEGVTDPSLFAPVVNARRVRSLGRGQFPEPVRPTWDQLVNGSMDAQYVEVQGVVTDVQTNRLTLRTEGGVIVVELRLADGAAAALQRYENALVRIRGCLFASWDYVTHQVRFGEVRIYDANVVMDQAAPKDLFSTPAKTVPELRLFDPQASVFQRVKVTGQLVFVRGSESFLIQNGHGIRFVTKEPLPCKSGDLIEVVGFPDVFGPAAPVLRETLARKLGHADLPAPRKLTAESLLNADFDATLVRVEGILVDVRHTPGNSIYEMQSGIRNFVALLRDGEPPPSLILGSRVELTGVYAAQSGNRAGEAAIGSFELLLNHASNIRVLARPPWWTLERLLVIVGALVLGLAATALWITQLRRKVEARTEELGRQIQERQRVEHQREMEQERSRIAHDLHDELGSGITEIGMLAARAKSASALEERRRHYLDLMGGKAREMVTALDEIVWAMNPRHDSLNSLISYFSLYADRFLGLAGISWKIENETGMVDQVISSRHRHQLFLVFKEALTNVVRHSGATEVRVAIRCGQGELQLTIADNGQGLTAAARSDGMDGVRNMGQRMERLGGTFALVSEPGQGTSVRLSVPTRRIES